VSPLFAPVDSLITQANRGRENKYIIFYSKDKLGKLCRYSYRVLSILVFLVSVHLFGGVSFIIFISGIEKLIQNRKINVFQNCFNGIGS
jgi:hypothetical protein